MDLERFYAISGLFLSMGGQILHVLDSGGTAAKLR